jgi:hypothetical protein
MVVISNILAGFFLISLIKSITSDTLILILFGIPPFDSVIGCNKLF